MPGPQYERTMMKHVQKMAIGVEKSYQLREVEERERGYFAAQMLGKGWGQATGTLSLRDEMHLPL